MGDDHEECEADEDPGQGGRGEAAQEPHADLGTRERADNEERATRPGDLAVQGVGARADGGGDDDGGQRRGRGAALIHAQDRHEGGHDDEATSHPEEPGEEARTHASGDDEEDAAQGESLRIGMIHVSTVVLGNASSAAGLHPARNACARPVHGGFSERRLLASTKGKAMSNVLIVSGHPRLGDDSVANKKILEELTSLLPGVEIDHLDELYPDYVFDVEAEQSKLAAADVIVLQYPLWWYGWPSLLQKWVEDVFVRGFSHGSTGTALRGKKLVVSLTTGAAESYYDAQPGGIERFLAAVKATSALTGLEYAGVLPLYGVSYANRTDEAARADMVERSREHAKRLAVFVSSL